MHSASDVRQIEIHTSESLIVDSSLFEVEIAIVLLKKYKIMDSDQILAELVQAGGENYCLRSIDSFIPFGIRKNSLITGMRLLLYQFTKRVIILTVVIIMGYHCYQLHTQLYPVSSIQG
jgi:hypothetical protein